MRLDQRRLGGERRPRGIRKRHARDLDLGGDAGGAAELAEIAGKPIGDVHRRRWHACAPPRPARCAAAAPDSATRDGALRGGQLPALRGLALVPQRSPSAASPIVPVTSDVVADPRAGAADHGAVRQRAERRDRNRHRPGRAHGVAAEQRTAVVLAHPRRAPRAKALSQASPTPFGQRERQQKARGFAPLAARSDRLTRSALRAIASGGSSGKKCTPPTMASVVSTRS